MFAYDKQNSLSFQNITQTMKIKKSKKEGLCFYHNDKPAKYKDRESQILYCTSCAIQTAAKGGQIEDFPKKITTIIQQKVTILNEIYEDAQRAIQLTVQKYKSKYQKLQEMITEMYISDFQWFNKRMQENNGLFVQMKSMKNRKWNRNELVNKFQVENHHFILYKIENIMESIDVFKIEQSNSHYNHHQNNHHNQSYSNSHCNSNNKKYVKSNIQSPIISHKHTFQIKQKDNKSLKISNTSLQERCFFSQKQTFKNYFNISQKSQKNTNSYASKNNSTIEQIQIKKSNTYEDTPESIKCRTSDTGLKVTSDMAVTMFEKIDICQSINMEEGNCGSKRLCKQDSLRQQVGSRKSQGSSYSSFKSKYRYGALAQSQQQQK